MSSQEENVFTTLVNAFRYGVLAIVLTAFPLSGCISYEVSKTFPSAPPAPEPPKPSGTMLKSQFRIGISPDYMPLAHKDPTVGLVGWKSTLQTNLARTLGKP